MIQHVNAIYEHGVLKPLGPLQLSDQEVVSLSVETVPNGEPNPTASSDSNDVHQANGLIGLFADEPELLDQIMESVHDRRARPWRVNDSSAS